MREVKRHSATPVAELALGEYGGAEYFFADVDGDGRPEILAYQGPGVFGAACYKHLPHVAAFFPATECVTAFRSDGSRLWTWGQPNPPDKPYICHAAESCVATGDVDNDGNTEVVIATGGAVVVLDGRSGQLKASRKLPGDNFYIVQVLGEKTAVHEAALVLKNGEEDTRWRYGQPVLGLNSRLEPVWGPKVIPGGGHFILAQDVNGDGRREYLIGYCAVSLQGEILWTVDGVDPAALRPGKQHVDYTDAAEVDGHTLYAIAGSDRFFLVAQGGQTRFKMPHVHVQGAALGRFAGSGLWQAAFYNAPDGPIVLCELDGKVLWERPAPRLWAQPVPVLCQKPASGWSFHRCRPLLTIPGSDRDWIGYADGGWPWGMNGIGEIELAFPAPPHSAQPEWPGGPLDEKNRLDDLGYGYGMQTVDLDADGQRETIIYDRRFAWVFKTSKL